MSKRVLKGIFVTFAAAAVCVPLAACGGTGKSETATESVTETATVSSVNTETAETTTSAASETTASSAETETTTPSEISGTTPLENASVKTDSLRVDVKGYQVYPAGIGGAKNSLKPVVVFYYDVTNSGDKEIDALSAWTEVFEAYQNLMKERRIRDRNLHW